MMRSRKRRITSEGEMLEPGSYEGGGSLGAGRSRITFMEEVNYSMEEIAGGEDAKYVMIPNNDKDLQAKDAFKKKRKGTL
jgi:hypothetical protein